MEVVKKILKIEVTLIRRLFQKIDRFDPITVPIMLDVIQRRLSNSQALPLILRNICQNIGVTKMYGFPGILI